MNQKIIKPGVVRRIAEKIVDEGINIPKETVDICLTAFLDTIADILSEGDSVVLNGYINIYPKQYKAGSTREKLQIESRISGTDLWRKGLSSLPIQDITEGI